MFLNDEFYARIRENHDPSENKPQPNFIIVTDGMKDVVCTVKYVRSTVDEEKNGSTKT